MLHMPLPHLLLPAGLQGSEEWHVTRLQDMCGMCQKTVQDYSIILAKFCCFEGCMGRMAIEQEQNGFCNLLLCYISLKHDQKAEKNVTGHPTTFRHGIVRLWKILHIDRTQPLTWEDYQRWNVLSGGTHPTHYRNLLFTFRNTLEDRLYAFSC